MLWVQENIYTKALEELYSLKWNKEVDMKQILKRLYIDEKEQYMKSARF